MSLSPALPPLPSPSLSGPGGAPALVTVAPQWLLELPSGSTLEGVVSDAAADGRLRVAVGSDTLELKTPRPALLPPADRLAPGDRVALRIAAGQPQPEVVLRVVRPAGDAPGRAIGDPAGAGALRSIVPSPTPGSASSMAPSDTFAAGRPAGPAETRPLRSFADAARGDAVTLSTAAEAAEVGVPARTPTRPRPRDDGGLRPRDGSGPWPDVGDAGPNDGTEPSVHDRPAPAAADRGRTALDGLQGRRTDELPRRASVPALEPGGPLGSPADAREIAPESALPAERRSESWTTMTIPLAPDASLLQARLMFRRIDEGGDSDEGSAGEREEGGRRFVFDVVLRHLGRVQVDGLLHGGHQRLDLLVRSEQPIAAEERERLRALASAAGERAGITSSVGFRAAPPGFVERAETPAMPPRLRGLIV